MQDYYNRMHAMVVKVCEVLSDGLGVDPAFFVGCISESMSALRQIHYSSEVGPCQRCGQQDGQGGSGVILLFACTGFARSTGGCDG